MKYYALSGAGNRIPHERSIDQGGRASGEFTNHAVLITHQPGELRSTCKHLEHAHTHRFNIIDLVKSECRETPMH